MSETRPTLGAARVRPITATTAFASFCASSSLTSNARRLCSKVDTGVPHSALLEMRSRASGPHPLVRWVIGSRASAARREQSKRAAYPEPVAARSAEI